MNWTVTDHYQLVSLSNAMQELFALDRLWTANLPPASAMPSKKEDRAALIAVGERIDVLWDTVRNKLDDVEPILSEHHGLDAEAEKFVDQLPINREEIVQFMAYVKRHGGLLAATKEKSAELRRDIDSEQKTLRGKLGELRHGGAAHGDMSHRGECGLIFCAAALLICTGVAALAGAGIGGFIARGCISQ